MAKKLVTILGPTATGKTKLAVQISSKFDSEIISADSRQVYKFMDIGTGKDLSEYQIGNIHIKYHLIDIVEPSYEYNVFYFQRDFVNVFNEILNNKNFAVLCGGTGLYLSSILQNYKLKEGNFKNSEYDNFESKTIHELQEIFLAKFNVPHVKRDLEDKDRLIKAILIDETKEEKYIELPEMQHLIIGVFFDREVIRKRIEDRLVYRLENGMIDEVKKLIEMGISIERLKAFGLEYKYLTMFILNEITYNDMFQKLFSSINSFSKRQMTWFRKMEREGIKINWVKGGSFEITEEMVAKFLNE